MLAAANPELLLAETRKTLIAHTISQFGRDSAEDFAQETFLKFYRNLPAYTGEWEVAPVTSYLLILLKQVVSDYVDAPAARYETALQQEDTVIELSPAQRSIWWEACRDEIRGLLRAAPLPALSRRCVRLRMENETQAEIAFRLGLSQQQVSRLLAHAELVLSRRAAKSSVFVIFTASDFRAFARQRRYHRPQRLGTYLANQKLRRMN